MPINTVTVFSRAMAERSPMEIDDFHEFFRECEEIARDDDPNVAPGALANARGRWYEWLIALIAEDLRADQETGWALVQLPNVIGFDIANLYKTDIADLIFDLREKVEEVGVSLVTSNPDFAIISNVCIPPFTLADDIGQRVSDLSNRYLTAVGECELNHVKGYVAAKLSLRPDRRLQVPHEGSLMKALYKHIQTRQWEISAPGISYHVFATAFTAPDRAALRTVATHSIVDVSASPQRAVDGCHRVSSVADVAEALQVLL